MERYIPYYKIRTIENLFAEMWFPVKGYEGYYECSNYARIKSLYDNFNRRRDFILSQFPDKDGYLIVRLSVKGIGEQKRVHVIVGDIFKENPLNKPIYNHNDGVKWNNLPYNLIPSTYSENTIHAYKIGLLRDCNAKITREQVLEIAQSTKPVNELCEIYGLTYSTISKLKNGKVWAKITGIKHVKKRKTKLIDRDIILEIFYSKESGISLSKKYNVTETTVSGIKNGRYYSNITGKHLNPSL